MHPPGSKWISQRAAFVGLFAACVSVLLVFAVGLAAATFAVRDRTERAVQADAIEDAVAAMRGSAERTGEWPMVTSDGFISLVEEQTPADAVAGDRLVLVGSRLVSVDRSTLENAVMETPAVNRDRSVHENGFGFDRVDGPTLGEVLGSTRGVGVPLAFASGEVIVVQDQTPVAEVWPFVAGVAGKTPKREFSLDLYRLAW